MLSPPLWGHVLSTIALKRYCPTGGPSEGDGDLEI